MELSFVTLDVFTTTKYEGNPLAIVKVPAHYKDQLSQAQKQNIAREFNLSETAFLHESAEGHGPWTVDIFTTDEELPFAGHPTVGAAHYVLNMTSGPESGVLITKSGPVNIFRGHDRRICISISHNVRIHYHHISDLANPSPLLSLNSQLAELERQAPLVSIVKGMTFLLVELPSLEMLAIVQCTGRDLTAHRLLDEGWREGFMARYYYVLDGHRTGPHLKVRARMMEGTMEDPATGSAACALGSYLAMNGVGAGADGRLWTYQITQGVEMGRESEIWVGIGSGGDGKGVDGVTLSGNAAKVMEGKVST